MSRLCTAVLAVAMGIAAPLHAQTAAELLQKGIYSQETLGDIDAAIRLYQQVVALGADARGQAAQAQYRLGLCLLRKGSHPEATKAFEKLIADYPDQKELVAAARQRLPGGLKLIPPPWQEGEMLALRLRLPTGLPVGYFVQAIEKSHGGSVTTTSRTHASGVFHFSRSEADAETMRPRASSYRHTMLGEFKLAYEGKQARVETSGKESNSPELTPNTFDNESAISIMRRLPLADGFKTQFEVLSPIGTALIPITVEVVGMEELKTSAGTFQTYKLDVQPVRQKFWISADRNRYLVRMEVNGATAELEQITRLDAAPEPYNDATRGIEFKAPNAWLTMANPHDIDKRSTNIGLFDPEAKCTCVVWTGDLERPASAEIEERISQRTKRLKDYKVRPDTMRTHQVKGREAISYIADFTENDRPMVESLTLLVGENKGAVLFARVPALELKTLQPQLDSIRDSIRLW